MVYRKTEKIEIMKQTMGKILLQGLREAEKLLQPQLRACERRLGREHFLTQTMLKNLSRCKKLLGTSASLLVTGALLVVTMFAIRNKCLTTRCKKLLGAPGIATRNREATGSQNLVAWLLRAFLLLVAKGIATRTENATRSFFAFVQVPQRDGSMLGADGGRGHCVSDHVETFQIELQPYTVVYSIQSYDICVRRKMIG